MELKQKIDLYESAYAHIMGRTAYEAMARALPTADHPFTGIMNAGRKVVFGAPETCASLLPRRPLASIVRATPD